MDDSPVNLDDGELWIPSDIFPAEETHHHHRYPMPSGRPRLEDLGRQFNNLNYLLDRHRLILSHKARSIAQGLEVPGPMKQYALTASSPNGCYGLKVGPTVDHGLSSTYNNYDYEFEYPNTIPTAPSHPLRYPIHHLHNPHLHRQSAEYEQLIETRIGSMQQGRHQTQLFPFQATGFGSFMNDCRTTGSVNGSTAGTGVFIPRATASHKFTTNDAGKRKLGHTQQRGGASRKLVKEKAEEDYSNDLLPKDWSY